MADQNILFILLFFVFVLLIWGRWRYDLVAFGALLVAAAIGVIPTADVFSGFGHPAVVVIALVLIVSRGLSNSGAIELLARDPDSALWQCAQLEHTFSHDISGRGVYWWFKFPPNLVSAGNGTKQS